MAEGGIERGVHGENEGKGEVLEGCVEGEWEERRTSGPSGYLVVEMVVVVRQLQLVVVLVALGVPGTRRDLPK